MKIILDSSDIKRLIHKEYEDIGDIKIDESIEVVITVKDSTKLKKVNSTIVKESPKLTEEEVFEKEAKSGVMSSGGEFRVIQHIG